MELSNEELLAILKIVQESDVEFLELESEGFKLVLSKHPLPGDGSVSAAAPPIPRDPAPAAMRAPAGPPSVAAAPPAPPPPPASAVDEALPAGTAAVTAPMLGVFYSRPEPGAAPFVVVGARVEEDTTVGLIEVMKVFNAVKAGVAGTVERILVHDGQVVEIGQRLMLVRTQA